MGWGWFGRENEGERVEEVEVFDAFEGRRAFVRVLEANEGDGALEVEGVRVSVARGTRSTEVGQIELYFIHSRSRI